MSWTLIICKSARSYGAEMESFLAQDVLSQTHTFAQKRDHCFSLLFEMNATGSKSPTKQTRGEPQTHTEKHWHERQRVRFSKRETIKVGERSILTWRRKEEEKKKAEEGFISCWPVAASQRESLDWRACVGVCIQKCVCSIEREEEEEPLAYCVHCKKKKNCLYSLLIPVYVNGGKENQQPCIFSLLYFL